MRIVCPSCAAAYDVPDSLLTAGRAARCARCSGEWIPIASAAPGSEGLPAPADPTAPTDLSAAAVAAPIPRADRPRAAPTSQSGPTAMDRLAANPAVPAARYGLRVAWAASVVLLVLVACGAYTWRSDIIHAWPPSVRMYAAFGLHADMHQVR